MSSNKGCCEREEMDIDGQRARLAPHEVGRRPAPPRSLLRRSMTAIAGLLGAAAIAVVVLTPSAPRLATLPGTAGFVYTADEDGRTISSINLATGFVQSVGVHIAPHNVQTVANGTLLLAVGPSAHNHDGEAAGAGLLLVFDPTQFLKGPVTSIKIGTHPAHVVADAEGKLAFITDADANVLTVVDLKAAKVVASIATGRYPHGLRMSPDGTQLYLANVLDGTVSVIDTKTLNLVGVIGVGASPVQVGFAPDGKRAYVSLRDENAVAVIDTAARQVIARVAVGQGPIQLFVTPDDRFVYVANQGSPAAPGNTVSVIATKTNQVVETVKTGQGAHGVSISDDAKYAFVTNINDGTVAVIDTATQAVVATFAVGEGPNGVTFRAAS